MGVAASSHTHTGNGYRLANYKYINMDEAIEMALKVFDDFSSTRDSLQSAQR